jgi:hypothetical protein
MKQALMIVTALAMLTASVTQAEITIVPNTLSQVEQEMLIAIAQGEPDKKPCEHDDYGCEIYKLELRKHAANSCWLLLLKEPQSKYKAYASAYIELTQAHEHWLKIWGGDASASMSVPHLRAYTQALQQLTAAFAKVQAEWQMLDYK